MATATPEPLFEVDVLVTTSGDDLVVVVGVLSCVCRAYRRGRPHQYFASQSQVVQFHVLIMTYVLVLGLILVLTTIAVLATIAVRARTRGRGSQAISHLSIPGRLCGRARLERKGTAQEGSTSLVLLRRRRGWWSRVARSAVLGGGAELLRGRRMILLDGESGIVKRPPIFLRLAHVESDPSLRSKSRKKLGLRGCRDAPFRRAPRAWDDGERRKPSSSEYESVVYYCPPSLRAPRAKAGYG